MSDLVIDADIMRAAGESEHPHSRNARDLLEAVRGSGHRLVQSPAIKSEHDKHSGKFAMLWRASMISRKRWVQVDCLEDPVLRDALVEALPANAISKEVAVLKDAHLLECAASADRRIVSKDRTARDLFRLACPNLGEYRRFLWGDMTESADSVIEWVKKGCVEAERFRLCPTPRKRRRGISL